MSAATTAAATWTVVRCPVHPAKVLGELQGADAVLRKGCPSCPKGANLWRYEAQSGEITLECQASASR